MYDNYFSSFFLFFIHNWSNILRIAPQDYKILEHRGFRYKLFAVEFCALAITYQDRSLVRLKARYPAGLAGLAHGVYRVAHSHRRLQRLEFLIKSDQHAWVHRQCQVVQEEVVLPAEECVHFSGCEDRCEQASKRHIRKQELV